MANRHAVTTACRRDGVLSWWLAVMKAFRQETSLILGKGSFAHQIARIPDKRRRGSLQKSSSSKGEHDGSFSQSRSLLHPVLLTLLEVVSLFSGWLSQ